QRLVTQAARHGQPPTHPDIRSIAWRKDGFIAHIVAPLRAGTRPTGRSFSPAPGRISRREPPMPIRGGRRFAAKNMRQTRDLERISIPQERNDALTAPYSAAFFTSFTSAKRMPGARCAV